MSDLRTRALRCSHLARQLSSEVAELFMRMTEETKAANVKDLTDFSFVKAVMQTGSTLEPLALQLKEVYLTLGLMAFTQGGPDFLAKVREDIQNNTNDVCDCDECKKVGEEVVQQAIDIVKKSSGN